MKTIKNILVICTPLLMFACSEVKNNGTEFLPIKIDNIEGRNEVALSEIAKGELILLPTSDSLIMDNINRVHNNAEYIHISDVTSVYRLSYDGKLISQLNRQGEGPDEYLNITDFSIDPKGNVWVLSRTGKTLSLYSWDGTMIKRIKLNIGVQNIGMLGNDILLYTGNEENDNNKQIHLLNTSNGKVVHSYKNINEDQSSYLHIKGNNAFRKGSANTTIFTQLFNDTVYRITPDSLCIEHIFDWAGHNIPESFYRKGYSNIMDFFQAFHSKGIYAYGINFFTETDNSYWISYYYQQKCHCAILSKHGNEQNIFCSLLVDSLNGYPINLIDTSTFVQDDSSIVIPFDAIKVKEYLDEHNQDTSYIPNESNPFLLIIRPF